MNGNDFITWVLRSPFQAMLSKSTMLITVTGHKTGRTYTTPVGYYEAGDSLWILTSRNRTWWRNLRGGAPADLLLKGKSVKGYGEIELDGRSVEARLIDYIQHTPQAAKPMGIGVENGIPKPDDIARAAKDRLFVKIKVFTRSLSL